MRENGNPQMPLAPVWGEHDRSKELQQISILLDEHPQLNELVTGDVRGDRSSKRGRKGMSGEQILRIGLLYMIFESTYEELAYHLGDSASFRAFARLPFGVFPRVSTLKNNLKRVRPETWEQVNRALVTAAMTRGIEKGRIIRTDCTVVETNIHEPSDSSLLWDCVRVITRILKNVAERFPEVDWRFHDRTRRAKKRAHEIDYPPKEKGARKEHRDRRYRDLIEVSEEVYEYGVDAMAKLKNVTPSDILDVAFLGGAEANLRSFLVSMRRVIDQTRRRIIDGEKVPAQDKVVSIFETHTDIIIKKNREVLFGHKICLTGGKSSMILDATIEGGNPADSTMVERTIERQIGIYGRPPRQATFDGGFASKDNLQCAKEAGVEDVMFHKKCGLEVEDMAKSPWVFRKLRKFRAGIEGCISTLKRAFGMSRCTWRGERGFKSYVWASIAAFNAVILARQLLGAS
jgi:IS5 family transposase